MPNVVGLKFQDAQAALQKAGVLVPSALGYFSTFPITATWQRAAAIPSTVLTQSIAQGVTVAANAPLTLGVAEFPIGVAFP